MKLLGLRRITSSGSYIPAIDGIRFLAISLVLVQHIFERVARRSVETYGAIEHGPLQPFFAEAYVGVGIFFSLSGYILVSALLKALDAGPGYPRGYLSKYFIRRVTRIEPPYFVAITLVALFLLFSPIKPSFTNAFGKIPHMGIEYLTSVLYVHNIAFGERSRILGVAWSLEIEVQFYLLAPLFALGLTRLRRFSPYSSVLTLTGLAALWCVLPGSWMAVPTIVQAAPFFIAGMMVAELQHSKAVRLPHRYGSDFAFLVGLALLVACSSGHMPGMDLFGSSYYSVSCFLILLGPLTGQVVRSVASWAWVATIGGMCYSIYLVHLPVLEVAASVTHRLGLGAALPAYLTLQFILLFALAIAGCTLFYMLIERPCMVPDWPQRVWAKLHRRRFKEDEGDVALREAHAEAVVESNS